MSDTPTANLGLPLIQAAQAQKHVTHNEALHLLDTLVQLAVLDRDLSSPPGSPTEGQRWIVAASPTGAWAGPAGNIAAWQDGAWEFSAPKTGWVAFVVDEGTLVVWNGSAWGDFFSTVTSIQNLARLGIGTTADATNPLSAKLNNALWVAKTVAEGGDGHLRYKLSKESSTKTLSFLFQNNYSGRAEIGLAGDDDFHFKVSPDGSSWTDALILSRTSGAATFAAAARGSNGTAGAPAFTFDTDPDTGLYRIGSDNLGVAANGAKVVDIATSGVTVTGTLSASGHIIGSAKLQLPNNQAIEFRNAANSAYLGAMLLNASNVLAVGSGVSTVNVPATTASTSTTTGALTVAGGVGIAGALNVAGAAYAHSLLVDDTASPQIVIHHGIGSNSGEIRWKYNGGDLWYLKGSAAAGMIAIGTVGVADIMRWAAGVQIGNPTGGDKGAGTLNLAGDIYKNNTAYTNPDFVFEALFTGEVKRHLDKPGARQFADGFSERGQRIMTLDEVREHARAKLRLPGVADACGLFERSDATLMQLELAYAYLWQLHDRLRRLEARAATGD